MGRSRGGLTTKIHACVDTNGLPVRLELTTGEAHDNRLVSGLLSDLKSGAMLLADRGYDADWIRALVSERGAWANIPPKRNRKDPICFSPYLYRARNLVERFFNRIKQCRRVATIGTTNSRQTTSPSSNLHLSEFGYALMSPRPSYFPAQN
jgi:transposase